MGFAAIIAAIIVATVEDTSMISVGMAEFGYGFGLAVVMVLATLSVTTEYRFSTIRTPFPAHASHRCETKRHVSCGPGNRDSDQIDT